MRRGHEVIRELTSLFVSCIADLISNYDSYTLVGKLHKSINHGKVKVQQMDFFNDNRFVIGGNDGTIRIFNQDTLEIISTFTEHKTMIKALCCCKNSLNVVSFSYFENLLIIWDSINLTVLHKQKLLDLTTSIIETSFDNNIVFTSGGKNYIETFNLRTMKMNRFQYKVTAGFANHLLFVPPHFVIIAHDSNMTIFNLKSRQICCYCVEHSSKITSLVFLPQNNTFASADSFVVKIWNTKSFYDFDFGRKKLHSSISTIPYDQVMQLEVLSDGLLLLGRSLSDTIFDFKSFDFTSNLFVALNITTKEEHWILKVLPNGNVICVSNFSIFLFK